MSTRWIVATELSGVAKPRRASPQGQRTAGTASSCVIMKFSFFVSPEPTAAALEGDVMMGDLAATARESQKRSDGGSKRNRGCHPEGGEESTRSLATRRSRTWILR